MDAACKPARATKEKPYRIQPDGGRVNCARRHRTPARRAPCKPARATHAYPPPSMPSDPISFLFTEGDPCFPPFLQYRKK